MLKYPMVTTKVSRTAIILAVPVAVMLMFVHNLVISGSSAHPPDARARGQDRVLASAHLPKQYQAATGRNDLRVEVVAQQTSISMPDGPSPAAREQQSSVRDLPPSVRELPASVQENSEVANADRLLIKFHGYTELSGEYRVRSDGSISVPLAGRIRLDGLSQNELEKILASRLGSATGREAYVTVEILEYRPVFVTGYVARPGAFQWRPGMTVLQAQALAGGAFRQAADKDPMADHGTEFARLQKLVAEQKRNIATLARLTAERRGVATIEVPAKLVALVGTTESERLIEAQSSALSTKTVALEAKRTALLHAIAMANRELDGLTDHARRQKSLLSTRTNYKNQIDELRSKGIVRAERTIDEATRVFDIEDRGTNINVAIARVRVALAGLERDRVTLEVERLADLDQEIILLDNRIAQLDIDIESSRSSYQRLTGQEVSLQSILSEKPKTFSYRMEVVRRSATGIVTLKTENIDLLQPGDTLLISLE